LRVLVVNAGSSSLKLSLLDGEETLVTTQLSAPRAIVDERELREALGGALGKAGAVGHRIVHGGERFQKAIVIDPDVEAALRELVDIAPLHQPKSLAALDSVSRALPGAPAVACFDTAFHATLDAAAYTYALPHGWRERWGVRRYGFHGLSHAWVARRAPDLLDDSSGDLRIVSCHLGAGASLCAIAAGRSIDTTMGFTPLEGLVMATRSGSVDPGLLLWLLERGDLSERELAHALEHDAGLLGLAGSPDMREVQLRAEAGDRRAELALAVYLHRLRAGIGAMTASLGGLDVLVFTGGVGENSAEIRRWTVGKLGFLGLAVNDERNRAASGDSDLSVSDAPARTLVVRAREDLEIARQVRAVLGSG
jgi:acetate kinase